MICIHIPGYVVNTSKCWKSTLVEQIEVTIKAAEGCFTKLDNVCESGLEYMTECASVCVCVCVCVCACTHTHAYVFNSSSPTGILLTEPFVKYTQPSAGDSMISRKVYSVVRLTLVYILNLLHTSCSVVHVFHPLWMSVLSSVKWG